MATHSTAPVVPYGGVPHTILVVDDEAAIQRAIARLLRREYNVLTASSIERAVELLRLNQVHCTCPIDPVLDNRSYAGPDLRGVQSGSGGAPTAVCAAAMPVRI